MRRQLGKSLSPITSFNRIALFAASTLALGCGTDSVVAPPDVTVATLTAASATNYTATVGGFVTDLPAVVARNAGGKAIAGILVKFEVSVTIADPASSTSLASVSMMTDSNGVARLPSWRLSTFPALNSVSASAGTAAPITFSVNAVAGPVSYLIPYAGDNQIVPGGTASAIQPQVRAVDDYSNPIANVAVSFSVTEGGGSITVATALTDAKGIATPGAWTVGSSGPQALEAKVEAFPAIHKLTFTAMAESQSEPLVCGASAIVPLGTTLHSTLGTTSCKGADGKYYDIIRITTSHFRAYRLKLESPDFDTYMQIIGDTKVAENDDLATNTSHLKLFLAEGTYVVVVSSHNPGALGKYSLNYTTADETLNDCEIVFVTRGVGTAQTFGSVNCEDTGSRNTHRYRVYLTEGSQFSVRLDEEDYYSYYALNIRSSDGKQIATGSGVYALDATLKAAVSGYYYIEVSTDEDGISYSIGFR